MALMKRIEISSLLTDDFVIYIFQLSAQYYLKIEHKQ